MKYRYGKSDLYARGVRFRDGTLAYEVTSYDQVGYIIAEQYQDRAAGSFASLARQGIMLVGPRRALLIQLISDISDFEEVPMCWRVGHADASFALPDGEVICPEGVAPPGVVFTLQPDKVHVRGNQDGYLAEVAEPLAGHPLCEFFMSIPFAGPLRAITNRVENFGWELVGPPATGKSTLLSLMSSTAGGATGGNDGNFGLTFATTPAAIEYEMRNYADLCMILDEANLFGLGLSPRARGNSMSLLFMSLGKGQDKARYQSKVGTYRFVFATSANEALARVIAGSSDPAVLAAVADRLMTISLQGRPHGILEHVPEGYVDVGDFLSDLVDATTRHHGTAMRHYLRALVDERAADPEGFADRVNDRVREFCVAANMQRNNGSARRIAEAFGLVYTACRIARHCGALPQSFDPLGSALECYRLHARSTNGEPPALRCIREIANSSEVVDLDRRGLSKMTDGRLARAKGFIKRNRNGDRELLIPPASLRQQVDNWNHERRDYAISRLLIRDGDKRHTVKRDVRIGKKGDRMVCIDLARLLEQKD